jgi:hypothetical protein
MIMNKNIVTRGYAMTLMQVVKPAGAVAVVSVLVFAGLSLTSLRLHAYSSETDSNVQLGFAIAPVKLNLNGLDPALVGKGSYIVNAKADCNGCHVSPDLSPADPVGFVPGHDPYFKPFTPPAQVNPASYLGGGTQFGPFPGQGIGGKGPLLVYSRNLTPGCDSAPCTNPLPEGGHTFQEFLTIIRTGHDFDHAHPSCPTLGVEGCALSPPFNADLLLVMPWPVYTNMSDDDIRAVYEYLRAIPCISHAGTVGLPANIYQTCPQ